MSMTRTPSASRRRSRSDTTVVESIADVLDRVRERPTTVTAYGPEPEGSGTYRGAWTHDSDVVRSFAAYLGAAYRSKEHNG